MGFPANFKIPVSDTQAYRQFGNSVVVPVIEYLAGKLVEQDILPVPVRDDQSPAVAPALALAV